MPNENQLPKTLKDALELMFGKAIADGFNRNAKKKQQPIQYGYVLKKPMLIFLN